MPASKSACGKSAGAKRSPQRRVTIRLTDVARDGLDDDVIARRAEPPRNGLPNAQTANDSPDPSTAPSLAEIYQAHAGFVWRTVRRLGTPRESVEDVMHEVFLVAHRRLGEYDGRAAMTTWLYHLSRGVVSNWRRGRRREAARLSLVQPPPNAASDPERATQRGQAAAFVRRFVASLDADKRLVFELAEVDGLPMPEVAEIAGIKLNTAYSRLRAARSQFQRAVARLRAKNVRGAG